MNKQEIIKALSGKCDMTIVESQKVYDAFITIIKDGLKKDDRIKFFEFGTFSVQKRKARKVYSPYNKKEIKLPARKSVKFNPSKKFKLS